MMRSQHFVAVAGLVLSACISTPSCVWRVQALPQLNVGSTPDSLLVRLNAKKEYVLYAPRVVGDSVVGFQHHGFGSNWERRAIEKQNIKEVLEADKASKKQRCK